MDHRYRRDINRMKKQKPANLKIEYIPTLKNELRKVLLFINIERHLWTILRNEWYFTIFEMALKFA